MTSSDGVPGFPFGLGTPSADKLADRLARALPGDDRDAGRRLLADRILGPRLEGASRKTTQRAYEEAAELLAGAPPGERLDRLETLAGVAEIREHASEGLALAIARFAVDHSDTELGSWEDDRVRGWRERGTDAIAAEAARRLAALEAWGERARGTELWEPRRPEWLSTRLTLQAAGSGAFGSAAGPLADFLRDIGEPADELELH
jgi:hypothetical protein